MCALCVCVCVCALCVGGARGLTFENVYCTRRRNFMDATRMVTQGQAIGESARALSECACVCMCMCVVCMCECGSVMCVVSMGVCAGVCPCACECLNVGICMYVHPL